MFHALVATATLIVRSLFIFGGLALHTCSMYCFYTQSLITDPALQPSEQIMSLLGEADNASIGSIDLLPDADLKGYQDLPVPVTIEAPPALGAEYKRAKADALLRPTSRVLRVRVLDGGEGYTAAPKVTVLSTSGRVTKECEAIATLDRDGHVDSVVVLDPGLGYGGKGKLPRVRISGPVQQVSPH